MTVRYRGRHKFDTILADNWEGVLSEARVRANIIYVDPSTGGDGLKGKTWGAALATLAQAISNAVANDIIVLAQGDYSEHVTIPATKPGLKILGLSTSGMQRGGVLMIGTEASNLISVRAHNVEIANVSFYQPFAAPCISAAEDAWGASTWRLHVHDCHLIGANVGTYGIWSGGVGTEAVATLIERCRLEQFVTANVRQNGGLGIVRDCIMTVNDNCIGVEDVPNTTSRPNRKILDNRFIALGAVNSIGIKVTNTPSAGRLHIDNNKFVNFADNNACISKRTGYTGLNYLGLTAIAIT